MTRNEALRAAEDCFERIRSSSKFITNQAQAERLRALAEAGKGYIELAKELRLGA